MGLQIRSRNLSFMTLSTQLQDSTKLFSHIFCLFCLFLELQNLVVFEKAVYKITNVFKFCRECIWSSTRAAKLTIISSKRITLFLSERKKKKKREKKKENYFLVWTGFQTITLYCLIKSNYFYNRLLNQSEDAECVTLQFIVDCVSELTFNEGEKLKIIVLVQKRCQRAWKTNFTLSLAVIHLLFIMGVFCFFSGSAIHVQTPVMSAHFTVVLAAMVNLAMMAELYNTTEISNISIWQ